MRALGPQKAASAFYYGDPLGEMRTGKQSF
jgi:hypothetical protein